MGITMENNNNGSTLITVVTGVSFLLLLAAILLSASFAGMRMKQMEYASKKSYYSSEQILDDIYHGIGQAATDCLTKTYADILSQVAKGQDSLLADQKTAYQEFSRQFVARLERIYPTDSATYTTTLELLRGYVTVPPSEAKVLGFEKIESVLQDGIPTQFVFRDVSICYQTADGSDLEAAVTTDIVIDVPYLNFFQDTTRILDYALIGNQGIYFDGTPSSHVRAVSGNLYAGISATESDANLIKYRTTDIYGGLNFYRANAALHANYLISKGNLNVRASQVTIDNADSAAYAQLWVESIRFMEDLDKSSPVEPSNLTINASTYVANDLELNARASSVSLAGEYYGYNNGTYETQEKANIGSNYHAAAHTQSSAIIINGNQSQLDLTNLSTLIVTGYAYVDLKSKTYNTVPDATGLPQESMGLYDEIKTGESLALKTNQFMYLAPASCLTTTNPVESALAPAAEDVWQEGSSWFGVTGGFVDAARPIVAKTVTNRTTGTVYTYYYLNFTGDDAAKKYAQTVLHMIDPVNGLTDMDPAIRESQQYDRYTQLQWNEIWALRQELEKKVTAAGVLPLIQTADDTVANIYTAGVISQVTPENGLQIQDYAQDSSYSVEHIAKMVQDMPLRYQSLYTDLEPHENYAMGSGLIPKSENLLTAGMPAAGFVDFGKVKSNGTAETGWTDYHYPENGHYHTVLREGNYRVPVGSYQGIIICTGDVTIPSGADVEGLVIAGGKIYVEGSGTISANRSIVQSILNEEMAEEAARANALPTVTYASYVLKDFEAYAATEKVAHKVTGTEYTDYISYQNWRKGDGQ